MNRLAAICIVLILTLSVGCARGKPHASESGEPEEPGFVGGQTPRVEWVRYYEALGLASKTRHNLLMLFFVKDSCPPCEMMEKQAFSDPAVIKALSDVVAVKIRGDVEIQMVRRFDVRTFPMVIFAEATGGEIDRKAGHRDPDFLLAWIEDVRNGRNTMRAVAEALKSDPDNIQLTLRQALNLVEADEIDKALELVRKASDIEPGNPEVLALFGLCYLREERLRAAEAVATAALQRDPKNKTARELKTRILMRKADDSIEKGDCGHALEIYSEVLELSTDNFDAYVGMGRAHKIAGDFEEAIEDFQKAAAVRPGSAVPLAGMGELYETSSDQALAEQHYLKAIELDPRYEPPYFRLMELYERNNKPQQLMEMYEKAVRIEPAGAHNELAWLLATSRHEGIRNPDAALRHALTAVELEPHTWYIDTLAEAYYALGNYDLAIAIINEAIAKGPEDIGYYQEQLQKFQKAKEEAAAKEEIAE
jgi:tetratricopeptide (TPR) repeat protein